VNPHAVIFIAQGMCYLGRGQSIQAVQSVQRMKTCLGCFCLPHLPAQCWQRKDLAQAPLTDGANL